MLIECPFCKSRVDAKEHGKREVSGTSEDPYPSRVVVGECPSCSATLVGQQEMREHPELGDICFSAGALAACAVMCGRALEGMCVHFKSKTSLASGLKELLQKDIIDKRLFQWGDELRKVRNLGAHATEQRVSTEDARDVLDFAHAITDYVFVLNQRFDRFMKRRPKP